MLSEAVFQPQKGSITLKKPFFAAISSQNYAFAKRYANVICCISAKKTAYFTSNNALQKPTKQAITARQGVNSKPVGAKEAYELRRHFHHTGGIQKQRLPQPTRWQSRKNGKADACGHYAWRAKLDCHGYRHHPEHTGKRLALFPVISQGGLGIVADDL